MTMMEECVSTDRLMEGSAAAADDPAVKPHGVVRVRMSRKKTIRWTTCGLLPLAMVLLEEEAQSLTFLPLCDECLCEDKMDCQFQSHGVLPVVVMACQEGSRITFVPYASWKQYGFDSVRMSNDSHLWDPNTKGVYGQTVHAVYAPMNNKSQSTQ